MASLQELAQQVEFAKRERDEANWYLGEERARREALETQLKALQRGLEESAARERVLQETIARLTRTLSAIRAYGGRRSTVRVRVPDAFVELRNGDESPLFTGSPRDLSSAGFGLETDYELPTLPAIHVTLNLPGCEPIESSAQLVWQEVEGEPPRYQSGCQLLDISPATRTLIEHVIEQAHPSPT